MEDMVSESRQKNYADSPNVPPHLLSIEKINYWMSKFILEIRRNDGNEYPPNTLYCISCALMRHVRNYCPEVNFFTQPVFQGFKKMLDSEMKRLQGGGAGLNRKRVDL